MRNLGKIFALVIYVLGAHALPLAHQFTHHHGPIAGTMSEAEPHTCSGHHHAKCSATKDAHSQLLSAQRVSSAATDSHFCSPTCALCAAAKSPVGDGSGFAALLQGQLPIVNQQGMETAQCRFHALGQLPDPRGPPVA